VTGRLSWEIRERASSEWAFAIDHRLFREVIADTVTDSHFERYLRIEFAFIDTAAVALGAAIRAAPDLADRVVLAAGLYDLLTSQVDFFKHALGQDESTIVPASAQSLHSVFHEVADGQSYADMLAAMLAAEWLYMTWCASTVEQPSARAKIRAWTELHTSPAFISHATWLQRRFDAASVDLSPVERERVADVFRRALAAEISFHDSVFEE
jgi:thiaminase (transcriptional activator TenA)